MRSDERSRQLRQTTTLLVIRLTLTTVHSLQEALLGVCFYFSIEYGMGVDNDPGEASLIALRGSPIGLGSDVGL